ncbi:hypothetical protein [Cellulomonas sp. B6]|jgi:hypothetical protein|uniref:hypothetical protein n=1 Tax=Cellulomonas sp. B6 TaxID=1295626 RepID=UPI00073B6E96|nr:hypothetical protein [Cellulomonas sp. B6]KSW30003.1 hypothetical protein ATM99_05235 [Cellulomonas sp. B6]
MTAPRPVSPALDGRHVLAVPAGTDLLPLARAWFPDARWSRTPLSPEQAAATRPASGARFRGAATAPVPVVGALSLDGVVEVDGPHPLDAAGARAVGLPGQDSALYGLPAVVAPDAAATPGLVAGWAAAVARRTGGGILPAARDRAVVPDPGSAVDLTLWSHVPLAVHDALPVVRPALSGSRTAPPAPAAPGAEPDGFTLTAAYEYDGEVVVRCERSHEVPMVLSTVDPHDHGPWAYRVVWQPPDPYELTLETPSPLHVIARQRVAPGVAGAVAALLAAVGGTVVDAGGFVVGADELERRARAR